MQITEAMIPKGVRLKTFVGDSSIIWKDHEEFGMDKE